PPSRLRHNEPPGGFETRPIPKPEARPMTDDLSDGAAQDPTRALPESSSGNAEDDLTHALPDALSRRRLFGLAGASAAGAAGAAASGGSKLNANSPKSKARSAPAAEPA